MRKNLVIIHLNIFTKGAIFFIIEKVMDMFTIANQIKDVDSLVTELQKLFSPKHLMEWIYSGVFILLAIIAIKVIIWIFRKAAKRRDMDPSLIKFFVRLIWIVGLVVIIMKVLSILNFSGAGLIAAFSAGVATMALALKDNVTDITGGIVILFSKPFVTGDFIEYGDHKGYVEKIDLMHTYIRTYDDTNVVIPNRCLTTTEVNNYTTNPEVRVQLIVPISYNADVNEVRDILLKEINKIDKIIINDKFFPKIRLENFGDSSVELVVRVWTKFENYWDVYYALTETVKTTFDEHKIIIPYNQLDVHIENDDIKNAKGLLD